ncbi:MAG: hypothetical protein LBH32_00505 [Dysgonamonadaceae bacterium]|jgi:hypothetical protein|nr:hypothetical protein [Dysgonamonadaceae bacterium]
MKKTCYLFLLSICLLLTNQLFANPVDLKERTNQWLKPSNSSYSQGGGRTGGEEPRTDDPDVTAPVGDAIIFMMALVGIYGGIKAFRKRCLCFTH